MRKTFSIIKLVSLSDHHELLYDWSKRIVEEVLTPFFEREEIKSVGNKNGHLWLAQHLVILAEIAMNVGPIKVGASIDSRVKRALYSAFDWMSEPTVDGLSPFGWLDLWLNGRTIVESDDCAKSQP